MGLKAWFAERDERSRQRFRDAHKGWSFEERNAYVAAQRAAEAAKTAPVAMTDEEIVAEYLKVEPALRRQWCEQDIEMAGRWLADELAPYKDVYRAIADRAQRLLSTTEGMT